MITGATELDRLVFTALVGDRTGTRQRLHRSRRAEAVSVITKFREQGRGQESPGTRQGNKDFVVRMTLEQVLHLLEGVGLGLDNGQQMAGQ